MLVEVSAKFMLGFFISRDASRGGGGGLCTPLDKVLPPPRLL